MPLSDGRSFHPSFQVTHKTGGNFSTENYDKLIRYYNKSAFSRDQRILLKSNHHLVLWNATDRKMARGTVLQDRHFSPEWKSYRDAERIFIEEFVQKAKLAKIEVWINEGMNVANGRWRLMTPPINVEVLSDSTAISRRGAEIEAELNTIFHKARRAGMMPGMHPSARGAADVILLGKSGNLDEYPQKAKVSVQLEDSKDLLEYHYENTTPAASWNLKHAWRVHGEGQRTRLKGPK